MAALNLNDKDINELLTVLNTALSEAERREVSAQATRRDSHDWPFSQEEINTYRAYMDTIKKWIHLFSQQIGAPDFIEQEEEAVDWKTIQDQAAIDLAAVQTDKDAYRFMEKYLSHDLRGRYLAIYRSDRHEMNKTPRQALDNLLSLPPLE